MLKTDIKTAFTLIELLVVVAIIGLLATLVLANFNAARERARDVQRKSDLKQFQTSLELLANNNNGLFPAYKTAVDISTEDFCNKLDLGSNCPRDPQYDATASDPLLYRYQSSGDLNTGTLTALEYVLYVKLEAGKKTYWVFCSNGRAGESNTVYPCPL